MSNSTRAIELNKSCDNQEIELNKIHNMDCLDCFIYENML